MKSDEKLSSGVSKAIIYLLVWISLVSLTCLTVVVANFDLKDYTLLVALLIAAIKSAFVINIFMHIKFEDSLFKAFLAMAGFTLLAVFVLTTFDVFYR